MEAFLDRPRHERTPEALGSPFAPGGATLRLHAGLPDVAGGVARLERVRSGVGNGQALVSEQFEARGRPFAAEVARKLDRVAYLDEAA